MKVYSESDFFMSYRYTRTTVLPLLDLLPLEENTDGRGSPYHRSSNYQLRFVSTAWERSNELPVTSRTQSSCVVRSAE